MKDPRVETQYMRMYYIRWPNGDDSLSHTLAIAPGRMALWEMLDEDADAAAVGVLVKQLPANTRFALDFKMVEADAGEGETYLRADEANPGVYETSQALLEELGALPDEKLTPAPEFFGGVVDDWYAAIAAQIP